MCVCVRVVDFDQHLGAVHSKCWSNYAFSHEKYKKGNKSRGSGRGGHGVIN